MKKGKFFIIFVFILFVFSSFIACSRSTPFTDNDNKSNDVNRGHSSPPIPKSKPLGSIEEQVPQNNYGTTTSLPPKANTTSPNIGVSIKPYITNKRVATFSTKIIDFHKNRIDNIRRAAKKLNNQIVYPGKTFSFNKATGVRSIVTGYKKAKVIVDGEREDDIGGGVCQISSTLFNAVKKLNLKVTERHTHSGEVHYLPLGMDASVNYGDKDFKFINTKSYPIKINVGIKKGRLIVNLMQIK